MRKNRQMAHSNLYHVYNRGINKEIIYIDSQDKTKFLLYCKEYAKQYEVEILSYCLMENHFHMVLYAECENLSKFMHDLAGRYAQYFNRKYGRCGHLWGDRFNSKAIENEFYLLNVINYVHNNPIDARIVDKPSEYKWSSYKDIALEQTSDIINIKKLKEYVDIENLKNIQISSKPEEIGEFYNEIMNQKIKKAKQIINDFLANIKIKKLYFIKYYEKFAKELKELVLILKKELGLNSSQISQILQINKKVILKM